MVNSSNQQQTTTSTTGTYRPQEKQVKITVGQSVEEEKKEEGGEVPRSYDEETYNRYLLDASGPKKVVDYSKALVDDEDLSSFDLDQGGASAAATSKPQEAAVEGQYRMKHTNEKFSIGGTRPARR